MYVNELTCIEKVPIVKYLIIRTHSSLIFVHADWWKLENKTFLVFLGFLLVFLPKHIQELQRNAVLLLLPGN